MSILITQRCDKCGNVVPQADQFWEVGLVVVCKPQTASRKSMWQVKGDHKKEYCRQCVEDLGLVPVKDEERKVEPPGLDDIFRELVQDEVQAAMEG